MSFEKTGLCILTAVLLLALTSVNAVASSLFSTASPAVATASNGKMYMVYRGADGKNPNALFWAELAGDKWTARGMIPGRYGVLESVASPAVTFFDGKIQLVYQGVQDKSGIYWASLDPATGTWTDHQLILTSTGDLKVVGAPAIAGLGGKLYVIYQVQQPQHTIYWASYQNGRWTNLLNVNAVP
jgi:hypothetical protein